MATSQQQKERTQKQFTTVFIAVNDVMIIPIKLDLNLQLCRNCLAKVISLKKKKFLSTEVKQTR